MLSTRVARIIATSTALVIALAGLSALPAAADDSTRSVSGTVYLDKPGGTRASAGQVRVDMLDYTGSVVPGASMTTYTTAGGHYELLNLEGSAGIDVRFTYVGSDDYPIWYLAQPNGIGSPAAPIDRNVFHRLGSNITGADVVIGYGAAIGGTLRDSKKNPVAGQTVSLYTASPDGETDLVHETTTNSQGKYRFRSLQTGLSYRVWYGGNGYARDRWKWSSSAPLGKEIKLDPNEVRTGINATLYASAAVVGTVTVKGYVTPQFDLSDDVTVRLQRYHRSKNKWVTVATTSVADDGVYAFRGLPPATFRVRLVLDGDISTGSRTSDSLKVRAGKTVTWNGRVTSKQDGLMRDFATVGGPQIVSRDQAGALQLGFISGSGADEGDTAIDGDFTDLSLIPVGDFDSDGLADLIARDATGALLFYPGVGGGEFGTPLALHGVNLLGYTHMFSPGDFNGDGWSDLIAESAKHSLFLYPGDGHGGFLKRKTIGKKSVWKKRYEIFSPGDITGDGNADLLAQGKTGTLWLYKGDGTGGVSKRKEYTTGTQLGSRLFSVGLVNPGACPDFFEQFPDGRVTVYYGSCNGGTVYRWPWSTRFAGVTIY